jgi:ferredoxin-NADP reductase/DMSO/TMAO reductase YedYZ heme-binding membrane subunit
MLAVVALWIAGHGVQDLATPADAVTSLGRLTGLVSANLLLVQVLLMARVPVVERTYGQDELARRHRLVGLWSFNLMLAHLVLISVGYALSVGLNPFAEFWELVVDYPGMLLALAGTLLLVLVVATSVRRARRRLRYESWHLLHLYAYLGVGLAIPHMLWTGQDFVSSPAATAYWWTLWGTAAGSILVWRVGLPLVRSLWHDLRVAEVTQESPDVTTVLVRGRRLDRLPAAAGQFFTWRFVTGSGWTRGHPYSLSATPDGECLRITVKDLGDGSRALATVRPGARVLIEGPYGRLHAGVRTRRKVTLLASGIGISPMRALLEGLPQQPGDVTLIYRARTEADLVLRAEIEQLAQARGARVFYVLGRRVRGRHTWLPESAAALSDAEALRRLVPDIAEQDVYLCGATEWMDAAECAARECGVPASRIHSERFSW